MSENVKLILEVILAIVGTGLVIKLFKMVFRFLQNHIAIGKNIDNSHVESGAEVHKIIGDNATMNIGAQIHYQENEPENAKEGDVWIG